MSGKSATTQRFEMLENAITGLNNAQLQQGAMLERIANLLAGPNPAAPQTAAPQTAPAAATPPPAQVATPPAASPPAAAVPTVPAALDTEGDNGAFLE
jgi:hypothetical protein